MPKVELESRPCPKCGHGKSDPFLSAPDAQFPGDQLFHVATCRKCGLPFQNPAVPYDQVGQFYPDHYEPYRVDAHKVSAGARWYLKHRMGYSHLEAPAPGDPFRRLLAPWVAGTTMVPRFVPGGTVLEVACAAGSRLQLLKELGWSTCLGNELSESAAKVARERGFEVTGGTIEAALDHYPDGSLDAILASFVIEHLQNPFETTRQLAKKLKPGGQFVVSTLNVDSVDFRMFREAWYDLDLPRHYVFFRKKDLVDMMQPDFELERTVFQAATNDFTRSAQIKIQRGTATARDRRLAAGPRWLSPVCTALALAQRTTRIVLYGRRKGI